MKAVKKVRAQIFFRLDEIDSARARAKRSGRILYAVTLNDPVSRHRKPVMYCVGYQQLYHMFGRQKPMLEKVQ